MKTLTTLLLLLLVDWSNPVFSQVSFDNYANIHTIGISLDTYFDDPEGDLTISLEYKIASSPTWIQGFEMVQTNTHVNQSKMFNSSIFYCEPNTEYHIRAILTDPTTAVLDSNIVLDTITTQALAPVTSTGTTYYVSPLGSGSVYSTGTPGNLQAALTLVQAGERVVLLAGTYNVGDLNFTNSGTPTNPITIEGISEGSVILDGSDSGIAWSADASTDGYLTSVINEHTNVVIADGIRLYPHKSRKELKFHKIAWEGECRDAGVDGFFRSGNFPVLKVKFLDDSNPTTKEMKVGRYNRFIKLIGVQHIRISKLDFRYYGSMLEGGVVLENSSNIRIDSCHFDFNDVGVRLEENSSNLVIDQCEFSDGYGDWNYWRMKATCTPDMLYGLILYGPSFCSGDGSTDLTQSSNEVNIYPNFRCLERGGVLVSVDYTGRGLIIKNSSFHDMVQGLSISPQPGWADPTGVTAEVDFYNNKVYNCSEDGMEADTYPRNVRIWNNTFHDVNAAISLASGADGPTYVFRNVFYNFSTDTAWSATSGNIIYGRSLKLNSGNTGTNVDNTGSIYFMHNTVFAQNEHYAMDLYKPDNQFWNKITLSNNILQGEDQYAIRARATIVGDVNSDFNNVLNASSQPDLIYYMGTTYSILGDFTSDHGFDGNSISAPSLFTAPTTYDFTLTATSPNIDAGTFIPGLNANYFGLAPDIGAFEFESDAHISESGLDANIKLYPNPVTESAQLLIGEFAKFSKAHLTITNLDGRILHKQEIKSSHSVFDTSKLTPGAYIVSIHLDNQVYVKKIIKSW